MRKPNVLRRAVSNSLRWLYAPVNKRFPSLMRMEALDGIRMINSPLSPLLSVNFFGADGMGSLAAPAAIFQQMSVSQIGLSTATQTALNATGNSYRVDFTGTLTVGTSGDYSFAVPAADGAILAITGGSLQGTQLVINEPSLGGDANLDGWVDNTDFGLWRSNIGNGGDSGSGNYWTIGDFNNDQFVDNSDFPSWHNNVGNTTFARLINNTDLPNTPPATIHLDANTAYDFNFSWFLYAGNDDGLAVQPGLQLSWAGSAAGQYYDINTSAPPAVSPISIAATAGSTYSQPLATFTSSVPGSVAADYAAAINWGDGSTADTTAGTDPAHAVTVTGNASTGFTVSGTHVFAPSANPANASVTVTHTASGFHGSASVPVTLQAPVGPVVTASPDVLQATAGSLFDLTLATFTPAGPGTRPEDYSIAITWGDGSAVDSGAAFDNGDGTFGALGVHTFSAANASTAVGLTITHIPSGLHDAATTNLLVSAPVVPPAELPALSIHGDGSAAEGSTYTLNIDHGIDTTSAQLAGIALTVNWGDGQSSNVSASVDTVSHTFTSGTGVYTISASGVDAASNPYDLGTVGVAIAPSAVTGLTATAAVGSAGTVDLAWSNASQIATGYFIEQSDDDGAHYHQIAKRDASQNQYSATNLYADTAYSFRVTGVNAAGLSSPSVASATTGSVTAQNLTSNDDNFSDQTDIGFPINFYGYQPQHVWINNNGNLTFDDGMSAFTPTDITQLGRAVIAPFFADVDTRGPAGTVSYQATTVDQHQAFEVDWNNVDYFSVTAADHQSLRNTFSVTLINRSDVAPGDFDINYNYGAINWDTGNASGGENGFTLYNPDTNAMTGHPARIGWSNGSGQPGTSYEVAGSGQDHAFVGSGPGAQHFEIRNPTVKIDIDSKNDSGFATPASAAAELAGKDDLQNPGKVVGVDDGTNSNGIPGFASGFPISGVTGNDVPSGLNFVPMTVKIAGVGNAAGAKPTFNYDGSAPSGVTVSGDSTTGQIFTPAAGALRLWRKDAGGNRTLADYLIPGHAYNATDLGFSDTVDTQTFFVEAVNASSYAGASDIAVHMQNDPVGGSSGATPAAQPAGPPSAPGKADDGAKWTAERLRFIDTHYFGPRVDSHDPTKYTFMQSPIRPSGKPYITEMSVSEMASQVVGAAADGSSLLLLQMFPMLPTDQFQFSYKLTEKGGAATDPYKAGSLFSVSSDTTPNLPAPDRSDNADDGQSVTLTPPDASGLAYYRAPNNFLIAPPTEEYAPIEVHISNANGAAGLPDLAVKPLLLRRPPLMMIHGFLGSPDSFAASKDGKVDWVSESKNAPVFNIIKEIDYEKTNTKGLAENFAVIPESIRNLLAPMRLGKYKDGDLKSKKEVFNQAFAVNRVDIVAHSMGELLVKWFVADFRPYVSANPGAAKVSRDENGEARSNYEPFSLVRDPSNEYLRPDNYMAGDIHRFVSLGTPFQGSPLAVDINARLDPKAENIAALRALIPQLKVGDLVKDTFFGKDPKGEYVQPTAVADLRSVANASKSAALTQLNTNAVFPQNRAAVKWHAIAGVVAATDTGATTMKEDLITKIVKDVLEVELGVNVNIPPDSDLIVPASSAFDGVPETDYGGKFSNRAADTAHINATFANKSLQGLTTSGNVIPIVKSALTGDPDAGTFAPLEKRPYGP